MWRFVLRENAAHYRTLLESAADDHRRGVLQPLIEAAERELAELDEASSRAFAAKDARIGSLLRTFLADAVRMHNADFGNIQLYEPESESLLIGAQLNFRKPFLDHFAVVTANDGSACGNALERGRSVWLEDVADEPMFAANIDIARETGFRAVQSTPLIASGQLIGMLSTHFRSPRRWSADDKVRSDAYAHHISSVLAAQLRSSVRAPASMDGN